MIKQPVRSLLTMTYDNWRHNVQASCVYRFQAYKRRSSAGEQAVEWHCIHCTRRPRKVVINEIDELFGPRDADNKVISYKECTSLHCPVIGRGEFANE